MTCQTHWARSSIKYAWYSSGNVLHLPCAQTYSENIPLCCWQPTSYPGPFPSCLTDLCSSAAMLILDILRKPNHVHQVWHLSHLLSRRGGILRTPCLGNRACGNTEKMRCRAAKEMPVEEAKKQISFCALFVWTWKWRHDTKWHLSTSADEIGHVSPIEGIAVFGWLRLWNQEHLHVL